MDVVKWILFGVAFWWMWSYSLVGCAFLLYFLYRSIPEPTGTINPLKDYKTIRALDGDEMYYAKIETFLNVLSQTHVNIVHGPLTLSILRKALLELQKEYQVLRLGIHDTNGTYYFHEFFHPQDLINLQVFEREDELDWQKLMTSEGDRYRSAMSEDKLLWKVIFLENRTNPLGPHEIILHSMHVILDGTSRMVFTNALLTLCGDLIDGKDIINREQIPLFKGQRELLFGNGNNSEHLDWKAKYLPDPLKPIAYGLSYLTIPTIPNGHPIPLLIKPPISRSVRFRAWKMSKSFTKTFYLTCKQNSVTFNSGFCAALCIAAQKTWNLPAADSFKFLIPVKLREMCKPKVGNEQICLCIGTKELKVPVQNIDSEVFWKYATYINNYMHHSKELDRDMINEVYGQKYLQGISELLLPLVKHQSKENGARVAHFMISNLGLLPYSTQFGKELHLDGWYAFQKERYAGSYISHFLSTVDNECCVTTAWTDGIMNQEHLQLFFKEVIQILESLVGEQLIIHLGN
eukprot:TRINITY_DN2705_c0_g1_i1.p1 TRINITY_DN2705_c0_g1~~TRINITY_DN2705_c0_g1_i1.p1  ORF type:complete len:518 (-),score=85.83 TRINITY_DN2705_c0_g1_i1:45-1598(-)